MIVSVKELQEEMVLSRDVEVRGMTLLKAGIILNSTHIRCLKRWNVSNVFIQCDNSHIGTASLSEEEYQEQIEIIERQFFDWRHDAQMSLLKSALLQVLAEEFNG